MQQINIITDSPYQEFSYILEDGKLVTFTLRFLPTQGRWLLDIADDNGFSVNGIFVCTHVNLLDKWHNIIKYGINISTNDKNDPFMLNDFSSGYAVFCVLNEDEKNRATKYLSGELDD